jgi:hypothetical protein
LVMFAKTILFTSNKVCIDKKIGEHVLKLNIYKPRFMEVR